jgi:S1-C subfamily serine protease
MDNADWDIPINLRPDPDDYRFDLERALHGVVGLRAHVPANAFTAAALGTERVGSGAVIREDGLVLTIGYLITEAETVWLITADGRAVPGYAVAYDQATGFGLVQALGKLGQPPLEFGDSGALRLGDAAIMAAAGGRERAIETKVIGRQEFAGYWEYVLDEAIYTAPAHPLWSGAALIDQEGRLVGIGSLILQQGDGRGRRTDMNMIVPIALLPPILEDLVTLGQVRGPARPWIGAFVMEAENGLVVGGLAEGGPAARAGMQPGDRVLGIGEEEITDLATLWRRLWASGEPGGTVRFRLAREGREITLHVTTSDRARFLRRPRMH